MRRRVVQLTVALTEDDIEILRKMCSAAHGDAVDEFMDSIRDDLTLEVSVAQVSGRPYAVNLTVTLRYQDSPVAEGSTLMWPSN